MVLYSYFILTNSYDMFHIECTRMRDWRLRLSSMKSTYKKTYEGRPLVIHRVSDTPTRANLSNWSVLWHQVMASNYCAYLVMKKEFDSALEAEQCRMELVDLYKRKAVARKSAFVVSFT